MARASRRPPLPFEVHRRFWQAIRSGMTVNEAAQSVGVSHTWGHNILANAGGVNPVRVADPIGRYLSFSEREEILRLSSSGLSIREIGRRLGRAPSTVSRELHRGKTTRYGYKPMVGQTNAEAGRRAPRSAKLATHARLRQHVQQYLSLNHSPEQISGRLKVDFPEDLEMRVSTETIYQAIYIQSRGGLKREVQQHLRTRRVCRKPRSMVDSRRTRIPGMINISERPAEVADRAVPGHWEGDLILGSTASGSAVGTLVERTSGFVMLLHLPENHTAAAVEQAVIAKMSTLPAHIRRSLTWDQGSEMANHAAIAKATGLKVYFCDPHSPWQRPSNENTNGLLRQYLPKSTDLSFFGAGMLDNIAAELNARPRKRHDFHTPAEVLDRLLCDAETGVA
ncbi:IS30 family transposase [Gordonia sp. DT30]|uniref:IS30 family transposase n=1 Tax=Gordonia sp. DT30 TaxID=3416546 RepID=UPI003CF0A552